MNCKIKQQQNKLLSLNKQLQTCSLQQLRTLQNHNSIDNNKLLMLKQNIEFLQNIKKEQFKVYNHIDEFGAARPTQIVSIKIKQSVSTQTLPLIQQLKKLSIFSHVYQQIFCTYYALLPCTKFIIGLAEPVSQIQQTVSSKIKQTIKLALKNFGIKLKVQVKPVLVFRKEEYLIRYRIKSIEPEDMFYQSDYDGEVKITVSKISLQSNIQPSNIKQHQLQYQDKLKAILPPNKLIVEIEKLFVHYSSQQENNIDNPFNKSSLRIKTLIKTKDSSGNYFQHSLKRQNIIFKNIFNPYCTDFIFDSELNTIYLSNKQSKYYNYYHFKDIVTKSSNLKSWKVYQPQNMIKYVQKVPLTFTLKPLFKQQIIQTPCRGQYCQHLGFVELRVLYSTKIKNQNNQQYFICPICKRKLTDERIIILNDIQLILNVAKHHEKLNNYNMYEVFLEINHTQYSISYSYSSSSISKETRIINKLYNKLIDPINNTFHPSIYYIIRNDSAFVENQK